MPGGEDSRWVELVLQQVRSLRYGVVEIIVHDSRVIQKRADLLVAILRKHLHLDASLYTILQILSLTLFEKTPLLQALSQLPPMLHLNRLAKSSMFTGFPSRTRVMT